MLTPLFRLTSRLQSPALARPYVGLFLTRLGARHHSTMAPSVQFIHVKPSPFTHWFNLLPFHPKKPLIHLDTPNSPIKTEMQQYAKSIALDIRKYLQFAVAKHDKKNLNLITHISTPEFHFYRADGKVLNEENISNIIRDLENELVNLPKGIHVNFGTFPVAISGKPQGIFKKLYSQENVDQSVYYDQPLFANIAICGESGHSPQIYLYAKERNFSSDPFYHQVAHLKTQAYPVVLTTTPNNIKFLKAYEICYDHYHSVCRSALEKFYKINAEIPVFGIQELIASDIDLDMGKVKIGTVSYHPSNNNRRIFNIKKSDPTSGQPDKIETIECLQDDEFFCYPTVDMGKILSPPPQLTLSPS
jgi:hypothetical protein